MNRDGEDGDDDALSTLDEIIKSPRMIGDETPRGRSDSVEKDVYQAVTNARDDSNSPESRRPSPFRGVA